MKAVLLAAAALATSACAGLKPGPAKGGEVLSVTVAAPAGAKNRALLPAARREAVAAALPVFLATEAPAPEALRAGLLARADDFCGAAKIVSRDGATARALVLVKLGALSGALEKLGAVRPGGFEGPPRVAVAIKEPETGFGAGRAADSVRMALLARGVPSMDAKDAMSGEKKSYRADTRPQALEAARAMGAAFLLFGSATAGPGDGEQWGIPAARARVEFELIEVSSGATAATISKESSTVDLTMAAAAGKALDEAGEDAAIAAASFLTKREDGRAELRAAVIGLRGLVEARELVARIRLLPEVAGAALGSIDGRSAIVRVFARGLRADELAARLQRLPGMALQTVEIEPDANRIVLEVFGREGE